MSDVEKFTGVLGLESRDIAEGRAAMHLPTAAMNDAEVQVRVHERADEPWVMYTPFDRAGLALSGGGIRSSAFTLGLLQSLSDRNVLPLFDYLATVSGGGYTGGFWTAWRRANGAKEHFPGAPNPDPNAPKSAPQLHEHAAIRHLREYSRFLAPRVGLGYIDMWEAVLALVAGMVPTLVFATALFASVVVVWRLVVLGIVGMAMHSLWLPALALVGTLSLFGAMEHRWQSLRVEPKTPVHWPTIAGSASISAVVLAVAVWLAVHPDSPVWDGDALAPERDWRPAWDAAVAYPVTGLSAIRGYLLPGGLAAGAVAVWVVRWLGSWLDRWCGVFGSSRPPNLSNAPAGLGRALERASARLLFLSLIALAFAVIWHLSTVLTDVISIGVTGGLSAIATAVFGFVNRFLQPSRTDDAAGLMARVRPLLPKVLAIVAVLLYLTAVTIACRLLDAFLIAGHHSPWWFALAPVLVVALGGSDHSGTGLHEFYRRRISRAFVQYDGDERPEHGDCLVQPTPKPPERVLERPVHLICCAANGVAADPVQTLYRGAKSAVLSCHGLVIGDRASAQPIRLSDALTASAAAFNSQMGGNSLRLGASVSMLMTALNLRLGLWLPTRARAALTGFGGWRLLLEMFGGTRTDGTWVHLSDGGHFDNTGAYELVRRHCRHIVIADCGADPNVRFDDLSELIRRVREDFGVEIDIDVTPLCPDDSNVSRQHVAVGTIFYGPRPTSDQGTLIVIKPTITGDEPPDVTQYRARNAMFPHESTGDQFFDEPQWEAYRRLGEHCGRTAFAYVADLDENQRRRGERVFTDAKRHWHPLPPDFDDHLVALSTRCAGIESRLGDDMPEWLGREFVPELVATGSPSEAVAPDVEVRVFLFFLEVAQLLEDAWLTCKLDTHGEHPLNEGWFAYIARWVAMPSFVRLWPLLRPSCSPGFREFIKRRYGLRVNLEGGDRSGDRSRTAGLVLDETTPSTEAVASPIHRFAFRVALAGDAQRKVEVGTAVIERKDATAKWGLGDVEVPAKLHGAGVVGKFLDAIVDWCDKAGITTIEVSIPEIRDAASLAERNRTLDLYRGRGFRVDATGTTLLRTRG